jgi:ABC-type dipeptide/oligopeptide/nickel transport system ATPase subunit
MTLVVADRLSRTFQRRAALVHAVWEVSFALEAGCTLAVVGESGAGKSTLGRLVAGFDRPTGGTILVDGAPPELRYGRVSPVQMVFQQPKMALNPILPVRQSVEEPLRALSRAERERRSTAMLAAVGIDPTRGGMRPAHFSGGQLQRIVIARALVARPKLLICDEPTSALDVSVQAQILNLLLQLQAEFGFACILVTHDLTVVRVLADDVLVLRDGESEEYGRADAFFVTPASQYAARLLANAAGAQGAPALEPAP